MYRYYVCKLISKLHLIYHLDEFTLYEGDPRSNANSCVISFTIAIFQDSLHQNYDALSNFPDPISIFTELHSNPRCLATRKCKVNDIGHG